MNIAVKNIVSTLMLKNPLSVHVAVQIQKNMMSVTRLTKAMFLIDKSANIALLLFITN